MKKASFAVMGLGIAVLIFAIVCFIVAGSMVKDIESYAGMLMGGFGGMDGGDLIDLYIEMGFDVGGFALFAYKTKIWFLIGGLAILGGGVLMFVLGGKGAAKHRAKRGGKHNYVPAGSYDPVCPVCGASVNPGSAFCMNCGSPMAAKPAPAVMANSNICTCCGASNEAGARFCVNCGSELFDHMPAGMPEHAAPVSGPAYGGPAHVGSSTGTISATVVNGEAGTIRLDTSAATSTGTVRIDTRAEAAPAPASFAPAAEPAPFVSETAPYSSPVMPKAEKPAEKPASMKSRLSKAGDL